MRWAFLLLLLPAAARAAAPVPPDDRLFFEKKVRPLLHARCLSCHSAAAKKSRGGLRLDSRPAMLKGGDSGPAVVPGQPAKSLLLQAVRHEHETLAMPPTGKLPPAEIAVLEEWVRRGAFYPEAGPVRRDGIDLAAGRKFWSFVPLKRHAPPAVRQAGWPRRRGDVFVLAGMEKHGLTPAPEANRRTLIRRLYFDLLGLPPAPEEVEAFERDGRPDACERLVERLLADPGHGERWGRFWLDLVRYCDVAEPWAGLRGAPHLYRDWVVRAVNDDLPYDAFVQKQLAADLMSGAAVADRPALGLLGLAPVYWKELKLDHQVIKGVVAAEWEERIHTLSSTVLGLTVACARCHDHKYDPITQEDYYALAGVFASTRQADLPLAPKGTLVVGVVEGSLHVEPDGPNRTKLVHKSAPQDVAVQRGGNPARAGPGVPRRFLAVLSPEGPRPFRQGSGRLELARALFAEGGSLAARVIVNRVWKHHLGEGLVRTPSDLGAQGERPTHPELLDDLAARFVAHGWSLRWLHREIVLSAVYRQSSATTDRERVARDPDNRWLARAWRRRLEVEAWRDALLAVTGTLDRHPGGPPLDLGQPANRRRTLYGTVKRRELNDILRLYDFPDPTIHSPARIPTTTPLQGLFVLNSPFMRRQAEALVRRLRAEAPASDEARIRRAYALLFGRAPTRAELRLGLGFVKEAPWEEYAQVLLGSGEFAVVD
jgi:hypothetical protein